MGIERENRLKMSKGIILSKTCFSEVLNSWNYEKEKGTVIEKVVSWSFLVKLVIFLIEMLNFKKSKMYSQYLGMCYWLCWETSNQVIWFWLSCEWDIQLTDFLQFTHIASNTIRSFSSYEHFVLHLYLCLCKHTFMHNLNGLILTGSKDFFGWIDRFDIN